MAAPHAEPALVSQSREMLAKHQTRATFQGIRQQPCRFLTSLCPNECGHASNVAVFSIDEYLHYEKPGQYGDEKQSQHFVVLTGGRSAAERAPADIAALIDSLRVGDKVLLDWDHDYVTNVWEGGGSAKFPERPVRRVAKVE